MPKRNLDNFKPGFRISLTDAMVIVIGIIAIALLARPLPAAAIVVAASLTHFFLFCNVFRLPRKLELIWAALFTLLAASTIAFDVPGWLATLIASAITAATFIAGVMRQPSYHGIGWRRINPRLPEWWLSQNSHD